MMHGAPNLPTHRSLLNGFPRKVSICVCTFNVTRSPHFAISICGSNESAHVTEAKAAADVSTVVQNNLLSLIVGNDKGKY